MAQHQSSPTSQAPEFVPDQHRSNFGFVGSDSYEYFERPQSAFEQRRSPVPEYERYENHARTTSPQISAASPPPPSSDIGRSPAMSDSGFSTTKPPLSPSAQYSEVNSPGLQLSYDSADKEAVYSPEPPRSKVPSYYASPMPGTIHHQNSDDRPQVFNTIPDQYHEKPKKKKLYKRWWFWLLLLLIVIAIAVGVACGVIFGNKKGNSSTSSGSTGSANGTTTNTTGDNPNVDLSTAVGGYINPAYYSKSGAWNGSGVAIAAANSAADQTIYAFYQDHNGVIQYTYMDERYEWTLIGQVNSDRYPALNGTPLSTVQHAIGSQLVWHLFYIDQNYYIRERVITNDTTNGPAAVWSDGPLSAKNLRTWQAPAAQLQACYFGNYYGAWSYNSSQISAGIHLWFATGATTFDQFDWTNGTSEWVWQRQFPDVSGSGGVGCQTWDSGMTEYVWFVNTKGEIAMSWRDNNKTQNATEDHPIGEWTEVRGPNGTDPPDQWVLQSNGEDVYGIRSTHLSITALQTASTGANLLIFFQEAGNDMRMYTRDAYTPGGLWQAAAQDPVTPAKSS
ncbi:hypothetical protein LTR05_003812 [Lithohypha guttulata]|uniref:Fucose-specific lectin n=1 Tax=Lithohypha guttulata TaxID=1690604 RepID=A0AAN7T2L6_9EURO|nr:hypothetical protein LTR05_003812 [Lithohypha guttulata]